jgi:hypothetical protein
LPHHPQVFRTYNASVTLDRLLREADAARARSGGGPVTIDERKADYDRANKVRFFFNCRGLARRVEIKGSRQSTRRRLTTDRANTVRWHSY